MQPRGGGRAATRRRACGHAEASVPSEQTRRRTRVSAHSAVHNVLSEAPDSGLLTRERAKWESAVPHSLIPTRVEHRELPRADQSDL